MPTSSKMARHALERAAERDGLQDAEAVRAVIVMG